MDDDFPTPPEYTPFWGPWHFVQDLPHEAPLIQGAVVIMLVATVVFFNIALRTQPKHFFSLPLFLTLVPFMLGSCISALRLYLAISFLPPGTDLISSLGEFIRVGYPFQFGLVFSSGLLLIYFCAYIILRNHTFPPRPERPKSPPPRYDY